MFINQETCIQCENCIPYCPMGAISVSDAGLVEIDEEECVECNVCYRAGVCPTDSLTQPRLDWPRAVRQAFSDPLVPHKTTNVPGRGTEEMKTNDVTGRFQPGQIGIAVELGRPGTGARFYDVEKVARACAELGVTFEPANPTTALMKDVRTGEIRDDIKNEKVLSAIVEFTTPVETAPRVLARLREVAKELETIFSLDIISRLNPMGPTRVSERPRKPGLRPPSTAKPTSAWDDAEDATRGEEQRRTSRDTYTTPAGYTRKPFRRLRGFCYRRARNQQRGCRAEAPAVLGVGPAVQPG